MQLDDLVKQGAREGMPPLSEEQMAPIRMTAQEKLDGLIALHTQMVALGASVYQVVDAQVRLQLSRRTRACSCAGAGALAVV